MELYGLGEIIVLEDHLETIQQSIDPLQSPHSLEEPTGNKLLVEMLIQQQSRPMEPYGLGVKELMDNLEIILQPLNPLQSLPLPEEPTGNKLLLELNIQQQSKLMELYGLGELMLMDI
jgi:hypothetical protein